MQGTFNNNNNLSLDEDKIRDAKESDKVEKNESAAKSKSRGAPGHVKSHLKPGDVVYLKSDGNKHKAQSPLLVTAVDPSHVTTQKILHATDQHQPVPKITSQKLRINEKILFAPDSVKKPGMAGRIRTGGDNHPLTGCGPGGRHPKHSPRILSTLPQI